MPFDCTMLQWWTLYEVPIFTCVVGFPLTGQQEGAISFYSRRYMARSSQTSCTSIELMTVVMTDNDYVHLKCSYS